MDVFVIDKLILIVVVFTFSLVVAMYSTLAERKVAGFIQDRLGPNRAGIFGILQPLADGTKFFFKEEIIPSSANKALFILGPSLSMLTACMTSAVIPWGRDLQLFGREISLQIADINIGLLYIFAVVSIGVYGIMIGGWASNNKFSLLGAIRASSQMISYEIAMGLSLIALVMTTNSLAMSEIVGIQEGTIFGISGARWNIIYQPLGFLIFFICALAECNRTPFDLPESEAELVGGYHTEYSSMKLGLYLFAEYINMFISAAIMAAIYFGGYTFPFMDQLGLSHNLVVILGVLVFIAKIFFFIFLFMWIRWTLPRFRYDQLMTLGWKILIPLALLNIIATGVGIIIF
ncbi:NADH-quinone oxidoreductase subunit NuoH [Cytophagaceae bacterium ABcell3]|nr:NADH-quinone oxidoreductase subunit NuoH [Cytophagaceae bacterium ABcell3]